MNRSAQRILRLDYLDILDDARFRRGLTWAMVAKRCGFSSQKLSTVVTGQSQRADTLQTVCAALGLLLDDICLEPKERKEAVGALSQHAEVITA